MHFCEFEGAIRFINERQSSVHLSHVQAVTSVGQEGVQALGKAGSVLDEQQKSSADRAKQWLSGLAQQGEKQAAIAQESLEVGHCSCLLIEMCSLIWRSF